MKGLKEMYLHPDNLRYGQRYRLELSLKEASNTREIREGTFMKLSLVVTEEGRKLAANFQFSSRGLPEAILWSRVKTVSELKMKGKKIEPEEEGDE